MRDHWARRPVAAIVMSFFLLLTVGMGEATHVCPVHDPALAAAAAAAMHHDAHAPMPGHDRMDVMQSHGDHHQSGHEHARCCCTGLACVANATTLPSQRVELPDVAIGTSSTPELPEYARRAPVSAYFIPFANGPPTLSLRSA